MSSKMFIHFSKYQKNMTSEKLAEFRAKGMLLDPKFDRLAVIGDKKKEKLFNFDKNKKIFLEKPVAKIAAATIAGSAVVAVRPNWQPEQLIANRVRWL